MEKAYLIINEDGGLFFYKGTIPDEIIRCADDGILDVVDISDPLKPLGYWHGEWPAVDDCPREFWEGAGRMKERPILFNGEMVRAILDGRKTQTRRVIKPQPQQAGPDWARWWNDRGEFWMTNKTLMNFKCPFGTVGDRLWVRETFAPIPEMRPSGYWSNECLKGRDWWYKATDRDLPTWGGKWKPSIHMPRQASRITLEITEVRVERVQDITDEDAKREGVQGETIIDQHSPGEVSPLLYRPAFSMLWDSINESRGFGWQSNPWVWVVAFERVRDAE